MFNTLLSWIQDANWPIADDVAAILATAGPEHLEDILSVLRSDDEEWKSNILSVNWCPEIEKALVQEIDPTSYLEGK